LRPRAKRGIIAPAGRRTNLEYEGIDNMGMRFGSIFWGLAFCGVLIPWSAPQAASAGECAQNQPATLAPGGAYVKLPILIVIHRTRVDGEEEAKISAVCYGKKVYKNPHSNEPGDLEFDAQTVTVAIRLGRDLKITHWRRSSGAAGDQGGIRMVSEPEGPNTKHPTQPADWPACAGQAAAAGETDISFDFSRCPKSTYHMYELHVEQCKGKDCKDIVIDPQIINKGIAKSS
jgi:hypothetical protein